MKISALIKHLEEMQNQCGPDQIIRAYCPEGEAYFPVTGIVYGGDESFVDLYTDSDEDESDAQ